jgi:hypothetical protein
MFLLWVVAVVLDLTAAVVDPVVEFLIKRESPLTGLFLSRSVPEELAYRRAAQRVQVQPRQLAQLR